MMPFFSAVITSRYPTTNNQLRNSSNLRQQATVNDGRVTLQPIQERQVSFATGTRRTYTLAASGSNSRKQRTVICYNCKGEGHTSKQCTKPKRKRGDSWFKDKMLLARSSSEYVYETQQAVVQNSYLSVQQDALILSVIEQLKPQVINCTKINLDNKSVNDTLTAELERYKEQVKVLKEGQNVQLKSQDNVSYLCEQSVKIDHLKQTLSEQIKEKESLMQTFTLLKNDFKKESRNIDREIALEKKIKQKAQQLEPNLYDGNVIKNTCAIVVLNFEETLMLAEESHSKMILKQQDPMILEKKVNTKPVSYVVLNQLSQDFEKRFVPQTELSAEQAFLSQNSMNFLDSSPSSTPTRVEVLKELAKVSMVYTSLKKLKHHLTGFDMVVKERTTATAITEGSWGSKQTKACSGTTSFELKTFEIKMNQVLDENERLLEQVIAKDIVNIIVNSSVDNASVNMDECKKCLELETELLNKKYFIKKETYDKLFRSYKTLKKYCISLEVDTQLNQENFQEENSVSNQSAPSFDQYFELNEFKALSQEKDTVISKLKERIQSLSGNMNKDKVKKDIEEIETINIELDHRVSKLITKNEHLKQTYKEKALVDNVVTIHTIAPEMLKVDVAPLAPRLLNNRTVHSDSLTLTQEQAAILQEIMNKENLKILSIIP
nr:hypothetical protein [Tanacetum cinerariifolium]